MKKVPRPLCRKRGLEGGGPREQAGNSHLKSVWSGFASLQGGDQLGSAAAARGCRKAGLYRVDLVDLFL